MIVPTIVFQFILPHEVSDEEALVAMDKIRNEMVKRALVAVHKMYLPQRVKRMLFTLYLIRSVLLKRVNICMSYLKQLISLI